jgi:hypothetical protein
MLTASGDRASSEEMLDYLYTTLIEPSSDRRSYDMTAAGRRDHHRGDRRRRNAGRAAAHIAAPGEEGPGGATSRPREDERIERNMLAV